VPALQSAPRATVARRPPLPEPAPEPAAPQAPPAPRDDHFGLALYHQSVGDFDNAIAHYRALLEQSDGSAEVHNNLGLLYEEHGQRDDAMKQFQRAIAIDPTVRESTQQPRCLADAREPAGGRRRGVSGSRSAPTRAMSSRW